MPDVIKVECKYCGAFIELSKAIKLNAETGEYEYICTNCALKFESKDGESGLKPMGPEPDFQ